MEKQVLDKQLATTEKEVTKKGIRKKAILVELLPLVAIILISFINQQGVFFSMVNILGLMSLVYLMFGWYIFKSEHYSKVDMSTTILFGCLVFYSTFVYFNFISKWVASKELVLAGLGVGLLLILMLLTRYISRRKEPLEYRFSLKLISRLLLYQVILLLLYRLT